MIVLDASIVNIALPSAQEDLGITNANRQWMVTAYTLAFGSLLLLGGRIADYTGRKRTFIIGLLGFAGASALGGFAPNQELLFAARAPAGRVRRPDGPGRAVHRHRDLHRPEGAGQGVRRLRCAGRRRCRDRPDRRRRPDRVRLVALVPRRQRSGRAARRRLRRSRSCTRARRTATPATTCPACCWRPIGLFSLVYGFTEAAQGQAPGEPERHVRPGLGRSVDDRVPRGSGRAARRVRVVGDPGQEPDAAAARRAPPQPWRVVPAVPARRCRPVRDVLVPHLLLPGQPGLQPAEVRLRVPAVQPRHHPDGRSGGPAAAEGRSQAADGPRPGAWRCSACCG